MVVSPAARHRTDYEEPRTDYVLRPGDKRRGDTETKTDHAVYQRELMLRNRPLRSGRYVSIACWNSTPIESLCGGAS